MRPFYKTIFAISIVGLLSGCANQTRDLTFVDTQKIYSNKSQLEIRQAQTKRFFNTNKDTLTKVIINTMQDELYYITFLDKEAGVISAKGKKENLDINIVTSINNINYKDFDIRISVNIQDSKNITISEYNEIYTYLFEKLRKSLFLEENLNKKTDLPKSRKTTYFGIIIEKD